MWAWGDSGVDILSYYSPYGIHAYADTGMYTVTCYIQSHGSEPAPVLVSDPSAPWTLRILPDTLVHPDSVVATIATGSRANDWACILPDGSRLYVTNAAKDSVSVIDAQTNSVTAVIAVPDSPTCCVASNSGQYVYVSCPAARSVAVIDVAGDSVVRSIPIDGKPDRLALLPNDSFLYVAHADSGFVSVIRTDNDSVIARVAVAVTPTGIAVKPGGEYVYVASEAGNAITVIRTADNKITSLAGIGGGPTDVAFSPTGDTVYFTCPAAKTLLLLRAPNLLTLGEISYDSLDWPSPCHAFVHPNGQCLYTTSTGSWSTAGPAVIRRSDNYLLGLTNAGKARMAVPSPDGSKVYVPSTTGVVVLGLRSGH